MMYLVMVCEKFDLEVVGGFPLPVKVQTDMVGYCPIYDSYDKAREEYPELEIMPIDFKVKHDGKDKDGNEERPER